MHPVPGKLFEASDPLTPAHRLATPHKTRCEAYNLGQPSPLFCMRCTSPCGHGAIDAVLAHAAV
jgi:hypothetical protein